MDLEELYEEIEGYQKQLDVYQNEGEHLHEPMQRATAVLLRMQEIRRHLSYLELKGASTPESKKFRTTIVDPFIDTVKEVATYESRKITALAIEAKLER